MYYFCVIQFITSQNRIQFEFGSMEDKIEKDNPVRFMDAFIDYIDLTQLGFVVNTLKPRLLSRFLLQM